MGLLLSLLKYELISHDQDILASEKCSSRFKSAKDKPFDG